MSQKRNDWYKEITQKLLHRGYTKIWHQVQGCFSTFDICTHRILSKVIIFFSNPLNKIRYVEIDPHMQKYNESFRRLPSYVS